MPYEVKQSSKGHCVHKQGGSPVPGGCHTSKSKALRHMRALYANEPRAAKESFPEGLLGMIKTIVDGHGDAIDDGEREELEKHGLAKMGKKGMVLTPKGQAAWDKVQTKEHTGVMVALPVPEMYRPLFIALQSLLPRGSELVPPDDLHLTLLYLGDSSSLESSKTSIFAGALNAVEWQQGIVGTLTGLARFNNDESGRNALVLLVDSPLLPGFRQGVWAQVTQRDISGDQRHGFIPHITLGYIPVDAKTPQIPVPPIKIVFDSYVVAWGDEHLTVPLSGVMTKDGKGYGARAGEKISGNLTRGNDGKFASGGESSDSAAEPAKPTQRRQRLGRTEAANERAKLERRESKRRATASESERKRQARATATVKRRQEVAARRAAAKRAKQEESERGRQANRKAVLDATGIKEDTLKALERFAAGGELESDSELAGILKSMNLIATTGDGGLKMGSAGRSLLAAIKSGDTRQAKDAIASGREAVGKRRAARIRQEDKSEKEASLSVFKDASGRFRWVLLSSNAYRDRDGEIVSIKALTEDVARADVDKDYGPLRWWHVPGLDIGDCDFNAMSGRMLVESGTFRSEAIGQSVYKAQRDLQASIGFRHPHTEPDQEKVYHRIRRFERSLTPVGRASNPFTRLMVKQEGKTMEDTEKLEQFKAMLGDEVVQQFLAQIQATQKEADEKSTYKSEEPIATVQAVLTPADVASYITANSNPVSVGSTNAGATLTVEATDEGSPLYAGDLSPDDLVERVASRVLQGMLPLFGGMVEQVKALATAQKSDDIALLQEQQARKEAESTKARQALQEQANALATQLKEVKTKLDELTGEQPRALQQGYRASQQNPISDNHRLKEAAPAGGLDPNFFSDFLGGKSNLPPV